MTYKEKRAAGLCVQCGKPNNTDKSRCPACAQKINNRHRAYRKYAVKAGLCTVCRKNKPFSNKRICEDCLQRQSDYDTVRNTHQRLQEVYKRRKEKAIAEGKCIYCGKKQAVKGQYCESCYSKYHKRTQRYMVRSERPSYGLCYTCGKPLDSKYRICLQCRSRIVIKMKA